LAEFLLDENLWPDVGRGLKLCGYDLHVIGDPPSPDRGARDQENVEWCVARGAMLITGDRGRKNREMLDLLAREPVHVMLTHGGLTQRAFMRAFVRHCDGIEEAIERCLARGGGVVRRRLKREGGLEDLR
jgi:predicted nuclease of predicted toxin-antitoxin system